MLPLTSSSTMAVQLGPGILPLTDDPPCHLIFSLLSNQQALKCGIALCLKTWFYVRRCEIAMGAIVC